MLRSELQDFCDQRRAGAGVTAKRMQRGHLVGDVLALLVGAVMLGGLMMAQGRRRSVWGLLHVVP